MGNETFCGDGLCFSFFSFFYVLIGFYPYPLRLTLLQPDRWKCLKHPDAPMIRWPRERVSRLALLHLPSYSRKNLASSTCSFLVVRPWPLQNLVKKSCSSWYSEIPESWSKKVWIQWYLPLGLRGNCGSGQEPSNKSYLWDPQEWEGRFFLCCRCLRRQAAEVMMCFWSSAPSRGILGGRCCFPRYLSWL